MAAEAPVTDLPRRERAAHRSKRSSFLSFLAELPVLIVVALAVAVLIKTFLVQPYYIPSGSMVPTIQINDRVMVNKLAYRLGSPQRGDVVVFNNPYAFGEVDEESIPEAVIRHVLEAVGVRTAVADDFIKRVVAVGGDTLEIRANHLIVNGVAVDEPYLQSQSVMPDRPPEIIPEGFVFVMGDNRSGSQDSRNFGPIPASELVGRAFVTIWPVDRWGGL